MIEPTSQTVRLNDFDFVLHIWNNSSSSATASPSSKGLVIVFHGFLSHGRYPTVRYVAELLAQNNYTVVAPDLRGHGASPGLCGYLPSRDILLDDGVAIVQYCQTQLFLEAAQRCCFLIGSSMGGTIALSVAQRISASSSTTAPTNTTTRSTVVPLTGIVLLAPMLQLSVSAPARAVLRALANVVPTWAVIPSKSSDPTLQYRDAQKLQECIDDPYRASGSPNGRIRVASAYTCVELAQDWRSDTATASITTPFLVLVADQDVVVQSQGSIDLWEQAPAATDKTLKRYPALHGLLCEPSPLVDTIQQDLLEWILARSN